MDRLSMAVFILLVAPLLDAAAPEESAAVRAAPATLYAAKGKGRCKAIDVFTHTPLSNELEETSGRCAVSGWSPWTMKAENIKAGGCGRRIRIRRLLDAQDVGRCDVRLAEYCEYCHRITRREKLACFQWYFVDEVFGYNATAVDAQQNRVRRSALRFNSIVFDPNRLHGSQCPNDVTQRPLDFLVMLDKSGGMMLSQLRQLLRSITFLVKKVIPSISPQTTRMAFMTFANKPDIEFDLNSCDGKRCVLRRIAKVNFTGGVTRMATALEDARVRVFSEEHGMRSCSRRVLLLLTDGGGQGMYETTSTWNAARALKRQKQVEIFAVGITALVNEAELIDVVSSPSQTHLYYMSTVIQTKRVFKKLRPPAAVPHARTR